MAISGDKSKPVRLKRYFLRKPKALVGFLFDPKGWCFQDKDADRDINVRGEFSNPLDRGAKIFIGLPKIAGEGLRRGLRFKLKFPLRLKAEECLKKVLVF